MKDDRHPHAAAGVVEQLSGVRTKNVTIRMALNRI
jgi:hypothetical protein